MSSLKGFYRKNYIAKFEDVNKHQSLFYKQTFDFIREISTGEEPTKATLEKIDRLLDILRITDAFIDDYGEIINGKYMDIIEYINIKINDEHLKEKSSKLLKDIDLINLITDNLKIQTIDTSNSYKLIQYCNYVIPNDLIRTINDLRNNKIPMNQLESIVYLVSESLKHLNILNDSLDIKCLNRQASIRPKNIMKYLQIKEIIKMWKYADAKLNIQNNEISFDATTELAKSFVTTRNLNLSNRQIDFKLSHGISTQVKKSLDGLGEEYFLGIRNADLENKGKIINNFGNRRILDITIKNWLTFLFTIHDKAEVLLYHSINFFIPCKDFLDFSDKELINQTSTILNRLRFKYDLLDTPVIYSNGEPFFYIPALVTCDPVHIMHILMRESDSWQNFRGINFEKEIGRELSNAQITYTKADENNKIEFKINGTKHEIDLIARDKNSVAFFIECKTFSDPFEYRDYRYELDKMISKLYLVHDSGHFLALKNGGIKALKDNVFNNKSNKNFSLYNFLNTQNNWNDMYGLFISNLIFPSNYITEWNKKFHLLFIHWFDFYKLTYHIPLNVLISFNNKNCYFTPISEKFDGISKKGFKQINNIQPLKKLLENPVNIKNTINTENIETQKFDFKLNNLIIHMTYFQ